MDLVKATLEQSGQDPVVIEGRHVMVVWVNDKGDDEKTICIREGGETDVPELHEMYEFIGEHFEEIAKSGEENENE